MRKQKHAVKLELMQVEEAIARDNKKFSVALREARDMLDRLRRKDEASTGEIANLYSHLTSEERRQKLEEIMTETGEEEFLRNLPELLRLRKELKEKEYLKQKEKNARMRRLIARYQKMGGKIEE